MPIPQEDINPKPSNTSVGKKDIYSKQEFLSIVRSKYPEYGQMDDQSALSSFLAKYPSYHKMVDWGELPQKKKVIEAYASPDQFASGSSDSQRGSSEKLSDYKQELDPFPDIYHKVKQMEAIFTEAESLKNRRPELPDMIKSGAITYTDENGKPCAKHGVRNADFTWGSKWKVVKDLSGFPSHEKGGVDLKIGQDGIHFKNNKGKEIKAAHGLLICNKKERE